MARKEIELEVVSDRMAAPPVDLRRFAASRGSAVFRREPMATDDELREYRMMLPVLRRLLVEWEQIRNTCPLAQKILDGET